MKNLILLLMVLASTAISSAAPLLNIDFGAHAIPFLHAKTGQAAVGRADTDLWNLVAIDNPDGGFIADNVFSAQAKWSDAILSPVTINISSMLGVWYTLYPEDGMFQSYLYPSSRSGNIDSTLHHLPLGKYNFYVYAHGQIPEENGVIELLVNGLSIGVQSTSSSTNWAKALWSQGDHYLVFSNVVVSADYDVVVRAKPGVSGLAVINGLQVEMLDSGVIPPSPPVFLVTTNPLVNIDFGAHENAFLHPKTGPAAIGRTEGDVWNIVSRDNGAVGFVVSNVISSQARWSDATFSPVTHNTTNAAGVWYTLYPTDGMFESYLYLAGGSGNIDSALHHLPLGKYNFYVYAHGQIPEENGVIELLVNGSSIGVQSTSSTTNWAKALWSQGDHYVVFSNVVVSADYDVIVRAKPGVSGLAVINGLQIEQLEVSPPDSLVAHYKMDGDALDSSSNHLDGTLAGPVPTSDRYGNTNKALLFAGGLDRINCGNPAAFNFAGDFTISVWAKQTGTQPVRYLVSKYDFEHSGTPHAYGLGTAESAEPYGFVLGDGPGYEDLRGATPLNDNAWHALALVFKNGSSISLYRDGVLNATRSVGNYPPFTNGLPLTIGGTPSGPGFGGAIDDVKIYNRALSQSEITGMFELDRPVDPVVLPVEIDARIPLYVGTIGNGVQGAVDGPISDARFDHPSTSVLDKAGNIYIIEANLTGFYTPGVGGHAIRRIDTNGVVSTWAGGQEAGMVNGPKAQAKFSGMGGMVFDHLGNAFVADRLNNLIRKIDVDGMVSTFAGSTYGFADGSGAAAQFRSPIGLCIDTNDNLYVADWENARIRQITPAGEVSTFAGGAAGHKDGFRASAQFNGPNYLFIAADGTIYVSDWLNGMVRRIGTDGMVATIATGLAYIESITVDAQGFLYASVPPGVHKLVKMDSEGHVIWQMGNEIGYEDGPAATAKVSHYTPPLFYSNGDFLMTDGIQRIRKVTVAALGAVTTPFIFKQPESTNTLVGGTASFSVLAAGGQLSYQWFKGTNAVIGAIQPSLIVSNLLGSDSGSYFVSVSNAVGHVDSQLAELNLNNPNGLPVGSHESHQDLFEYPQNIQILAASPAYAGFSASRMFSTSDGTDRGENLLFASGKSPGFTHFVEWKTKKAVTLTNIILHASGALIGQPVMQEFNSFVLKAKRTTNDEYHIIASIQPSHPYGVSALNYFTLLDSSFDPEVLQYFRAEFTQRDPANYPFGGPRVMELDGFGSVEQDSIAPVVTVTSPVEGSSNNEQVTLRGTITDNIGVTTSLYELVGGKSGSLDLDAAGKFTVPNLTLKQGTNAFKITARDGASNETLVVVKVNWTPLRSLAFSNIVSVQEGGQFSLPLALTCDGTVGALDAVIHYDTNLLGDVDFVWADALTTAFKQVSTSTIGEVRIVFALAGTALPSGLSTLGSFVARAHSLAAETTSTLGLNLGGVYDQSGSAIDSGNAAIDGSVIIKTRKIIGDNNANDRLDVGDASTILSFVAAPETVKPWDITGNDLNMNSSLDPGDAIKVLRAVVGLDAQPVIPGSMVISSGAIVQPTIPGYVFPPLPLAPHSGKLQAASVSDTMDNGVYSLEVPALLFSAPDGTLVPGHKLVVHVNLATMPGESYAGSSFRLTYPASLLRLANSSAHQIGAQVPLGSAVLWNVSPAANDYAKQDGQISFAAASAVAWPSNVVGYVAELSFDITEAVSSVYAVQVVLDRSEITQANGIIAVSSPKTLTLHSQAAQQAQVAVASISEDGKVFSLKINGQVGGKYRIDASFDLHTWFPVETKDSQDGVITIEQPTLDVGSGHYYRAVLVN